MKAHPVSVLPIVCYAALLAYAIYAALVVGHWPYYSHPDPKELPAGALTAAVLVITLFGLLSVVLIPVVYAGYRAIALWKRWQFRTAVSSIVIFTIGAAVWAIDFTLIHVGKHSLISWILD